MGLVHQIVAGGSVTASLEKLQTTLLEGGPLAQQHIKRLFADLSSRPIGPETHELSAQAIAERRASDEGKEGLKAFLEKRPPAWRAK